MRIPSKVFTEMRHLASCAQSSLLVKKAEKSSIWIGFVDGRLVL